ncbi:hypothetical protein BRE01_62940 [Brevibacillus reuszeri]|uniref:Lipoprotein n=1 Tax=Brevibacillus reuszeri TaxID=54915 RepID=A0A0K9YWB4_9BACL|nr:hypothetical protein [Brevibacillus reuszeri]KNB72973.1 hypothetical protein ADS79_14225 [Brevibacillus reuszeri]GED72592.1 hypothetical protein BRE01_62940 [Brevibacillus reuszeri]
MKINAAYCSILLVALTLTTSCNTQDKNVHEVVDAQNKTDKEVEDAIELIKDKNYVEALIALVQIPNFESKPEIQHLINYSKAAMNEESNAISFVAINLSNIPVDYSGPFASEVNGMKEKYSKELQETTVIKNKSITFNDLVGYTDLEVKQFLGEPDEILKTDDETIGKDQQRWWYKNKGMLYIADGKVWQALFGEDIKIQTN